MTETRPDRRSFLRTTALAALAVALSIPEASAAEWVFLGSRKVRLAGDVDRIEVGGGKGKFRAVQLRVRDNGIFMHDMRITFGNGKRMDVPLREHFRRGSRSRAIDLPGGKRNIRAVRLTYRSEVDHQGKAKVELWGRR
jgi:hypothetical protein